MTANEQCYLSATTIQSAIIRLFGTANHLFKIWLNLKEMGFQENGDPVLVTTSSPTDALKRLFDYGDPDEKFFIPFAHTQRFMTMQGDAARSVIQTTIQRWKSSGSVVTCDPTGFLDIRESADGGLLVSPTRGYPIGLGLGDNGFALDNESRVSIPIISMAAWYFRKTELSTSLRGRELADFLVKGMIDSLHISQAEKAAVFVQDDLSIEVSNQRIPNSELFKICSNFIRSPGQPITTIIKEDFNQHSLRIRSMKTVNSRPPWLNIPPLSKLKSVVESGSKAILLYGPPRTGKTMAIDQFHPRIDPDRTTIQIHDGWGYDNLIQGFRPDSTGVWDWRTGPLKEAIDKKRKIIVLEEINRTNLSQALGEVFSLIEDGYRGDKFSVSLRNGDKLAISGDCLFLMTMNTLDKSTSDIDDALIGRFAAVEFSPRVEDLATLLAEKKIEEKAASSWREFFVFVQEHYPMGQGYFASLTADTEPLLFYSTRLRPVLENHFREYRPEILEQIDTKIDSLFSATK